MDKNSFSSASGSATPGSSGQGFLTPSLSTTPAHSGLQIASGGSTAVEGTGDRSAAGPASTSSGGASGASSTNRTTGFSGKTVIVNQRQRGNPLLQNIRNVPWEFGDIVPDYVMGMSTCALFLSLKYHNLNPEYIHDRIKQLGKAYSTRVLLVHIDVKDPHHPLKELAKLALMVEMTLIPAWSSEEAGKYVELYKVYENKPADMLQARGEDDYLSKLTDALTTVKSVNKTDAKTLAGNFRTFRAITEASQGDLSLLPGVGLQKAKRLHDVLHQPFLREKRMASEQMPSTSRREES